MSCPTVKLEPVGVEVKDLHKSFGDKKVLDGVSFSVKPGEIYAIMGPSGSGKSVILRHIIGLMQADSGKVLIEGKDASDTATHRQYVTSIVFQDGALFNSMSVYDNLALYPLEHRICDKKALRERIERVLAMLSLQGADNLMPSELSGGMKKRVAVARALMMQPQLLLYDEPTSELDPELAASTAELIAAVRAETGLTSIVVTHDRELAASIAGRVALLRQGRIAFEGSPAELAACQDTAVQAFLHPVIDIENPRFRKQADKVAK
ncbi:MAG: ATP-binding cassette domain-containing protein [Opitutales bacterium]|nr:ATP-binding cassette domain-containing protein [Opitutales bacterium]